MKSSCLFFLLLVALTTTTSVVDGNGEPCACPFAEDNEKDCYVYGSDGAAYPRASDECVNDVGASRAYINALEFWIYCPYANSTDYDLEEFLVLIRQETETEQAQYVMSIFIENMDFEIFAENNGVYSLPDVITNNLQGIEVNCTEKENECWNQVKAQMRNRTPRWDIICEAWHTRIIPEFMEEQGIARRILCEGGLNETETKECANMLDALPASNCAALEGYVKPEDSGVPLCNELKAGGSGGNPTRTVATWGAVAFAILAGLLV